MNLFLNLWMVQHSRQLKRILEIQLKNTYQTLTINEITITPYLEDLEAQGELNMDKLGVGGIYRVPGRGVEEYTAKLRIDYTITDSTFQTKDFIIINI